MRLNFIENYGTGLARIFETYKVEQRKLIFYVTNRFFCITLPNLNYCYVSNEHDEPKNEHDEPKMSMMNSKMSTIIIMIILVKKKRP